MINHTIQPENVKRFVNLKHSDGVMEDSCGFGGTWGKGKRRKIYKKRIFAKK
jgi:hypothetical protein